MPYLDDDGRLNNFAIEPKIYRAEPATKEEKRNFIILAIVTLLVVSGLIFFVASSVSTVS